MFLRRASRVGCTAERLEEVLSGARTERSPAPAPERRSGTEMAATGTGRLLQFPSKPIGAPFLTRVKSDKFAYHRQAARWQDPLRHFRAQSSGEGNVETDVVSFLVVFVSCIWLLFWLISEFAQILAGLRPGLR